MEKKENKTTATRAEKKEIVKNLIKEALSKKEHKHNDLIEETANLYVARYENETDNINDVKGRVGSVLDIMKKEEEVKYEGGMYALSVKKTEISEEEPIKKTTRKRGKKEEEKETVEEKPKKTTRVKKAKATEAKTEEVEEKKEPLPPAPLQPITPTAPVTPEVAPEPIPESKPRRGRKKAQAEPKVEEKAEERTEEKAEQTALTEVQKGELAQKATVMDMSFLFGAPKATQPKASAKVETEKEEKSKEQEKEPQKEQAKTEEKREYPTKQNRPQAKQPSSSRKIQLKKTVKTLTADDRLKEAFLKKIRSLGGDYFEYYSVYLLERYSRKNGRRLESLRVSAGDHDGGIDGEIELTDRLGFRETIYIQSKNWNPEKGDERLWVVGETLLQQFIGACACRQAKDGKQHCRGIFITTSRFTPEAKRILENMSDKIVGYDGEDLYETAKECSFGLIKKNGEWAIDESLLSGEKAFFSMN